MASANTNNTLVQVCGGQLEASRAWNEALSLTGELNAKACVSLQLFLWAPQRRRAVRFMTGPEGWTDNLPKDVSRSTLCMPAA